MNEGGFLDDGSSDATDGMSVKLNEDSLLEQRKDHSLDRTILEKILQRRRWRIHGLQCSWQV